jgi:hypothetical protein
MSSLIFQSETWIGGKISAMSTASQLYHVYEQDALHLMNTQIGTANYLLPPRVPQVSVPDHVAFTNEEVWLNVLPPTEAYRAGMTLTLENFFLFEWFPRAPGLYFTPEGRESREYAKYFLRKEPVLKNSYTAYLIGQGKGNEFLDVYDPGGKMAMLKGGIGCFKLRPKLLDHGESWLLSASSTGVAHEGFPVALPNPLFEIHRESIKRHGALRCTLRGKLQFIPHALVELYRETRRVPQVYLEVHELTPIPDDYQNPLLVSVGISFSSSYEGPEKMYASYATFDSRHPGELADTANWLEAVYVQSLYNGKVVTDFDEHMNQFSGAVFALADIAQNRLDNHRVQYLIHTLNLNEANVPGLFNGLTTIQHLHAERIERMDQSRTINIGSNATVSAPVVIANDIQHSFNTLRNSDVSPDLKALLEKLLDSVTQAARTEQSTKAENAVRDSRNLVEEATAKEPRAEEGVRLGERIKEWAQAIGEAGKPVIQLVAAILPLLHH